MTFNVAQSIAEMSKFHYWSTVGSNIWIAALAGYLNAFTTVSLLFERSSHMTGRATDMGRGIMAFFVETGATRSALVEEAVIIFIILTSFLAGAIIGTKLTRSIGLAKTIIVIGLWVGISCLMVVIELPAGVKDVFSLERSLWAALLCFPMGMQNAATTLTPIGRSTHITGTLTDLGISIASRTNRQTIHLFCRWGGFVGGSAVGLGVFLIAPALSVQLFILATCYIVTGAFFAYPAVKKRLDSVLMSM